MGNSTVMLVSSQRKGTALLQASVSTVSTDTNHGLAGSVLKSQSAASSPVSRRCELGGQAIGRRAVRARS